MSNLSDKKILDNKYEILGLIGSGGMAYVYKARNVNTNENVAIKVLKREYCEKEDYIRKFNNEARAVKHLKHPNIVQIYDVGSVGNVHYIAREYVDGITLEDYIKNHPTVSWEKCFEITKQLLAAVECAHGQHVIHRDIKPMNIMICEDGTVKLSDFGIAKAVTNATIEATKNSVGSIHYVSPEHARGGFVDERSDIYSIGVTMYEMIVGAVPFDGDTQVAIALKHLSGKFVQPHDVDPEIPMGVNDIIVRALMKDPGLRFQSATDMLGKIALVEKDPSVSFLQHEDANNNGIDDETEKVISDEPIITKESVDSEIEKALNELAENEENNAKGETRPMPSGETKPIPQIQEKEEETEKESDEESKEDDVDVVVKQEETEEEKKKRIKKERFRKVREIIFRIFTYILAVAVTAGAAYFLVTTIKYAADKIFFLSKATYTIEDYTGYEAVSVIEMLEKENINVKQELVVDEFYLGAGFIVEQDVAAGKTVRKGDTINFKVSAKEGSFIVSDCVGKTTAEAEAELKKLNLKYETIHVKNNKTEAGKVFKMIPEAGSVVTDEDEVKLYVSDGKLYEEVTVPDLKGKSLTEAKKALEELGLSVGVSYPEPGQDITYILNPTASPSPVPPPTPKPTEAPEVTEEPQDNPTQEPLPTAEPEPTAVPMSLDTMTLAKKSVYASKTVQYQYPPAGTVLYRNETVDIYFYDITISSDNLLRQYNKVSFKNPTGDESGSVTFAVSAVTNDTGRKLSLYNKTIYKSIFPVTIGIPISYNGGTDVSVYADSKLLYKYLCK